MTRTDTHAPRNFDPAEYREVGYFDAHPEEGGCWMDEEVSDKDGFDGNYTNRNRCDHCGSGPLRFGVVFLHEPTDELVVVGTICAARLHLNSRSDFDRKQRLAQAIREQKVRDFKATLSAEDLAAIEWARDVNTTPYVAEDGSKPFAKKFPGVQGKTVSFIHDIESKLNRYGSLSEKQVAALVKIKARSEATRTEREAEAAAITADFPTGRHTIEGEVLTTKMQESVYGDQLKMLVRLDDGNKVWGSVPSSLQGIHDTSDDSYYSVAKGDRVRFTAEFSVSKDDEHFGFYKRPTKAEIVELAS